jgi:predicted PurR-regulated permease PerM
VVKIRSSTWALIALSVSIGIVFSLARVLAIIGFVSTLLSILFSPLVDRLSKRLPRGVAVAIVLVGFIFVVAVSISWIIANIAPGFAKLAREIPGIITQIRDLPETLPIPAEATSYVHSALNDAANMAIGMVKNSSEAFLHMVSGIVELIAIPVIAFYLLKDGEEVVTYFTKWLNHNEELRVLGILNDIKIVLRNYLKGQCIVSLISATAVCLYFNIVGLPYSLVFAAISAVAELAPVVGPVVASILAASLAYSHTPMLAVKTLIFYIIMLKINHNLVYPTLIGKATKLHPVAIVPGVLFFGHIFGVLGMVLAVPILSVSKIIFEHYAGKKAA